MTIAEDDYRRGFADGEAGRSQASGSDSYEAGWLVGSKFAEPTPDAVITSPRTVDVNDVLAELPRRLWTP